jgi:hypothetical protein
MKGELLILEDNLAFIFKKSDVNSRADKQAIALMITHLYHTHCVDVTPREIMVEDILKISKQNYIGLMIDDSTNEPRLKIIDFTERKLTEIKKMVYELATLEERS